MDNLQEKEIRISLHDVLFYMLRKWRYFILLGFACAFLLGAFRGVKLLTMTHNEEYREKADEQFQSETIELEADKKELDRKIADLEKKLEETKQVQEESLLMAMDPYDCWVASADVYIKDIAGTSASVLSSLYQSALNNGSVRQKVADKLNVKEKYVGDVIRTSFQEYTTEYPNTDQAYMLTDQMLVHVGLIAADEKTAHVMMDGITQALGEVSETIGNGEQQPGFTDTLTVLNLTYTNRAVEELETYQYSITDSIESMSYSLEDSVKEREKLEKKVVKMPWSGKEIIVSACKYFLLGGLLGGILCLVILFITCLYSNKILSAEELEKHTGLLVFPVIRPAQARFGAKIDMLLKARELGTDPLPAQLMRRCLSADPKVERYVIWGDAAQDTLSALIPDIDKKTVLTMDSLSSQNLLQPLDGQDPTADHTQYILFAKRDETTYRELDRKLAVIRQLKGNNAICVLYL